MMPMNSSLVAIWLASGVAFAGSPSVSNSSSLIVAVVVLGEELLDRQLGAVPRRDDDAGVAAAQRAHEADGAGRSRRRRRRRRSSAVVGGAAGRDSQRRGDRRRSQAESSVSPQDRSLSSGSSCRNSIGRPAVARATGATPRRQRTPRTRRRSTCCGTGSNRPICYRATPHGTSRDVPIVPESRAGRRLSRRTSPSGDPVLDHPVGHLRASTAAGPSRSSGSTGRPPARSARARSCRTPLARSTALRVSSRSERSATSDSSWRARRTGSPPSRSRAPGRSSVNGLTR